MIDFIGYLYANFARVAEKMARAGRAGEMLVALGSSQDESVNKLLNFSDRDKPRQLHKHALFSLKITVLGVGAALAAARSPARRYDF